MSSICFYFQVHQPYRLKEYTIFDIGNDSKYFENHPDDSTDNAKILRKVMNKCYLPANELILNLLVANPAFKVAYSLSGVFLDQIVEYSPEILESFQKLAATGQVEFLAETYYHSLSFIYSKKEFDIQVKKHQKKIFELFQQKPKVFRNTELIYNNELAKHIETLGFEGIITEGVDRILDGRSPNQLFRPVGCSKILTLTKNYKLSDDLAFRFSDPNWEEYPLTANKYSHWISQNSNHDEIINLFMDYETFGEHQWAESGIFDFLQDFPSQFLKDSNNSFVTPSQAINIFNQKNSLEEFDAHDFVSWADQERDLSAWLSNDMQKEAMAKIYSLENKVLRTKDLNLIEDWRRLQTSDHFYYMSTKFWADGDIHKYFSPYSSPYEAFIYYMNVVKDMEIRIGDIQKSKKSQTKPKK